MEKSLRKHNSEAKEIIAKEMILDQQLSRKKVLADINQGNYAKEIRTGNSLDAKTVVDTSLKSSCLPNGVGEERVLCFNPFNKRNVKLNINVLN